MPETRSAAAGGTGTGATCATIAPSTPKPSFSRSLNSSTLRLSTVLSSRMVTSWMLPSRVRPPAPRICEKSVSPTLIENLRADVGGVDQEEGERVELAEAGDVPAHALGVVAVEPFAADAGGELVGVVAAPGHVVVAAHLEPGAAVDHRVAGAVAEIVDAGEAADLGVLRIGGAAAAVPGGLALEGLDVEVGDLLAGQEVLARLLGGGQIGPVEGCQS